MGNLAPKSITLSANIASNIDWGGSDFQVAHGSAIIQVPIGIRLTVKNDTLQTVYIGLSYKTITNDYVIVDNKSKIGVQRRTTQTFGPNSLGGMGMLEKDLTQLTATLISAAPGNVTLTLELTSPNLNGSSSNEQKIGQDVSNVSDFITRYLADAGVINSSISPIIDTFTVPSGKRWHLHDLMVKFDRNIVGDCILVILTTDSVTGVTQSFVYKQFDDWDMTVYSVNGTFLTLKQGDTIRFTLTKLTGIVTDYLYQLAYEEMFL